MKKRKLKKSLATTATVMAVTTGVAAISNSAKADTVQNSKNTIQQTLPDANQQAQQNVCAAQDAANKANADVATANNDLNIANQNLADADQNVDSNKNQVKQTKEQLSSLEQTKENAQQILTNAYDEYYELLKQPVNISYTAFSGGGLSVYEGSMLDYIAYDNQGNLISENQAYKNFLANDYQGNIDLLKNEGIEYSDKTEIGIMIETPAAAIISDRLAPLVDFFSVGTNDLTQYTLACDRQNPDAEEFVDTHHEAVLRLIEMSAKNAHKNGAWIGICGELAADISLTETFLRMGIDELSVSPTFVLKVRDAVRKTDLSK